MIASRRLQKTVWRVVVLALLVCVALAPAWLPLSRKAQDAAAGLGPGGVAALPAQAAPAFAGSAACAACHARQAAAWAGSHHARAMQTATPATVLGDFNDARIAFRGSSARFTRQDGRFVARTEGGDGKAADFTVAYTFGVAPLQQYLVGFPDGRLQALPWAWDSRPASSGGQRWFHLYQNEPILAGDPLFWTGPLQTWNFMCAECHSTDVSKNYDAARNEYHTHFAEISVGCESCHGPGAAHIAWARGGRDASARWAGFASAPARRPAPDWTANPATGSPAHGVARPAGDEVDLCAHCHSRRGEIAEHWRPGQNLADTHLESPLDAGLFEDDGQMKDEVFNDQSFKQSKMYARGVVCTDCHDPHAGGLKGAGTAVCSTCHMPSRFATVAHTGHTAGPGAPDCISCHMPARTYMVVDRRHDHSFRIPRPDLSVQFGTPNACNACHTDKSAAWAADAVQRWHGPQREGLQTWTEAVHRARAGDPAARALLLTLAGDPSVPAIARATAIGEMQRFASAATQDATARALNDADPLVRIAALHSEEAAPLDQRWQLANGLLSDPVAAVRQEAGSLLAGQPPQALSATDRARLADAGAAYAAAQRLNADRPEGRAGLADFLRRSGDATGAEAELRAGLRADPSSVLLSVNLADLYRALGRDQDAAAVLRQVLALAPQSAAAHHALGLTLIRLKEAGAALAQLGQAAALAPEDARYAYVDAVALQSTGDIDAARRVANAALLRHPYDAALLSWALRDAAGAGDSARAAALGRALAVAEQ